MADKHSFLASPSATRAVLHRHGHEARYSMGQNFLVDDHVIGRILALADLAPDDVVLEVGPGIGTLTVALLDTARHVVAIEHDAALVPILADTTSEWAPSFSLVHADALKVDEEVIRDALPEGVPLPTRFVANLPYNVAATVILSFFQEFPWIEEATVMVQSEVADRICAAPDNKTYGAYTVKLSLYAEVAGRFHVGPGSFFPAPRVDSSVVKLVRRTDGEDPGVSLGWVATVVDAAFSQRRKTIRNAMKGSGFEAEALDAALAAAGIDPRVRAEVLSRGDFIRLAAASRP